MRNTVLQTWTRHPAAWPARRWMPALAMLAATLLSRGNVQAQATVTTLGGGSVNKPYAGYIDGNTLTQAKFSGPAGLALDPSGTVLFIADYTNNAIRMVSQVVGNSPASITSTFANATNSGTTAISHPLAVAVDGATNVFVLNHGTGNNGAVLHLGGAAMNSGGVVVYPVLASGLVNATAMTMDAFDNLYVTVKGNQVIRVTTNGIVTPLGTNSQSGTAFQGIAVLDNGQLALADAGNNGIWTMNPVTGAFSKFTGFHGAGDVLGAASSAAFRSPENISKAGGGMLVVADYGNNKVKLVDSSGTVSLLYGVSSNLWTTSFGKFPGWSDGPGTATQGSAESRLPYGVLVGSDGSVYVDEDYYCVLRHATGTGLSGPAPAYPQIFNRPAGIAFNPSGSSLYIADFANNAVEVLNLLNNQTTTFLTNGISHPASVLLDTNNNVYVLNQNAGTNGAILEFDSNGNFLGTNLTGLKQPTAFTMDGTGTLFITELSGAVKMLLPSGASNTLVTISTNIVTLKTNVQLQGIAVFDDGSLAVSDSGNQVIWAVNPISKLVSKLTGQLGTNGATLGASNFAQLSQPHQLARAGNNQLVIADYGNNRLVMAARSGTITNVLVSTNSQIWFGRPTDPAAGTTVAMSGPAGVAVNVSGQVFDAEPTNALIRGLTATVAAPPTPAPVVNLPYFAAPQGLAFDNSDNSLFIADYANNAVRLLNLNDNLTSTFLTPANGVTNPASVLLDTNENVYVLNQGTSTNNGYIQEFDHEGNSLATNLTGLNQPTAFTMDGNGNIFITELSGGIKVLSPSGTWNTLLTISTNLVTLHTNVQLQGIATFDDGYLAVSDSGNQVIWAVNPITKLVARLTGQLGASGSTLGASNLAQLNQPHQLARAGNNQLVIADYGNNRLAIATRSGTITNVLVSTNSLVWYGHPTDPAAGNLVAMTGPSGVAVSAAGEVFDSEPTNALVRGLTATVATPPSSPPVANLPYFGAPRGLAFDGLDNFLFIADYANNAVQLLDLNDNATSTFVDAADGVTNPVAVLLDTSDNIYVLDQGASGNGYIQEFDIYGNAYGPIITGLKQPTAFTMDGVGTLLVTAQSSNIFAFGTGISNLVATVTNANVSLAGIALFDDGTLAVSDAGNHVIWAVNPITKLVTKLTGMIGTNGVAVGVTNFATLWQPQQLVRVGGNQIVAADYHNHRLVLVQRNGTVITNNTVYHLNPSVANLWFGEAGDPIGSGSPKFEPMRLPFGVTLGNGGEIFASETFYDDIRGLTGTGLNSPTFNPGVPLPYFAAPQGIAFDNLENSLYIADQANNAVQRLDLNDNSTSTFLTAADGVANPASALVDTSDNVYVLNQGTSTTNGYILEFDAYGNSLGTNLTGLNQPTAFTIDGAGNIFISELAGGVKVLYPSGASSTIVTINTNHAQQLQGIAAFDDGNLAVSDAGNHVIWTINPITKFVSQLTGQLGVYGSTLGASNFAKLNQPLQLARAGNNQLVIADYGNNRLVVATRSGSITNVLVSTNSQIWLGRPTDPTPGLMVAMTKPSGVAVSAAGRVFDSEPVYTLVRGLTATVSTPPAPSPIVDVPYFDNPHGVAFDSLDNYLLIADYRNNAVQLLNLNDNSTSTFVDATDGITNPASVLLDTNDNVYVLNQGAPGQGYIQEFDIHGNAYGPIVTGLNQPTAFTMDGYGTIFVTAQSSSILAFGNGVSNLVVATITNANVSLAGIALFDDGTLAVSDSSNSVIWTVNPITKLITKLTGVGTNGVKVGVTNFATLNQPQQLVRVGGNQIVAADYGNNRVVLVQRNGAVLTNSPGQNAYHLNPSVADIWFGQSDDPIVSGTPKFVPMVLPFGVALGNGGEIFASETYYDDIRGLTGTGLSSPAFNPGVPLPFYANPAGIALNNEGTVLYVTDPANNTVSALNLANNQTTIFLNPGNLDQPVDVACDNRDNVYVLNQGTGGNGSILEFDQYGNLLGTNAAALAMPTAMKRDFSGGLLVAELNGLVQKFNGGVSNTLANITNANVQLEGIAVLDNGSVVVSDAGNQVLWKIPAGSTNTNPVLFTGVLGTSGTTFGSVGSAKLNKPMRLAQAFGGLLLIADSGNNRVVVADDAGTIYQALNSTNATLWFGLPIDPVSPASPNFVPMLKPVGLAIAPGTSTNGIVYTSEDVYRDIRGISSPGIQAPIPPPPAPLNLVATVTFGQVTLTWSAATGATNYLVQHSPSSGGPYTVIGSTSANTFTDNERGGSTNYYVVAAVNAGGQSPNSTEVVAVPLIPPPPAPEIGWFDYEENNLFQFVTVLHQVSIATYNNDQLLAINPLTNGVSTYYTTDGSNPSPTNGSTPPFYADGIGYAQPLPATTTPELFIKAINVDSIGQVSPISTAVFLFQVANPTITGNNAGQFTVSDITTNAVLYYTLDGTTPSNGPPSLGPVALTASNSAALSFVATTNVLFKVAAYRAGYAPSGIAQQAFSPSNFVANAISFGFASGEASSAFIAAAGQTFYAPVTLSLLPNTVMYSLQFNATVTNAAPGTNASAGPPITPGAFTFQSMLLKPDPDVKGAFLRIPPYMFIGYDTGPLNSGQIVNYNGTNFVNLLTTNLALNLLGVGWLERYSMTNLYPTPSQDLIAYSMAHDDLFVQANNQIIVGGYSFQVPGNAVTNQTYQIQIARPSATSDGIGAPGSDVYIAAPTNNTGAGAIGALKYVTVGQISYLAGSVYPFRWFNAGDFGSSNLVNADVEQVFQSAIYGLNKPPPGSDFFDAMDSCGGTYIDLGNGYLEFNTYISGPSATAPLFDGNDTSINQIAFGDGVLDVCDVYVTFRRSLDPSLTWFQRFWNNGQRVAVTTPNFAAHARKAPVSAQATPKALNTSSAVTPQVNFSAGTVIGSAGQTVQVPINATILGKYPLRVLMLNLSVVPLDGSPALATPVSFNQVASVLGTPYTTSSEGNANFAAVWLNSTNGGLAGTVTLGTLTVTIPASANSLAAYAIHFDHASASPNGLASFSNQQLTGLLTTAARTNSYYGDGIPDSWRLAWFGTIYNVLSASNACPSGDGVPNWKKYIAGVDPNVAHDFPRAFTHTPVPSGSTSAITWPSVYGKQYVIQRATSLFNGPWTKLSTNTGTGGNLEYDDTNTAGLKFYRVEILP